MGSYGDDKKRKQRRYQISVLIIIVLIHILLSLIKCTVIKVEDRVVLVKYNESRLVEKPVERCVDFEYRWNFSWEGWDTTDPAKATPYYGITNLEDMPVKFNISFAFFDDFIYPYDEYNGINYEFVKDKLPWDNASMIVENIEQIVGPSKSILFSVSADKPNPDKMYWAYADVTPTTYKNCTTTFENNYLDVIMYANETVHETMRIKKNIWEIIIEFLSRKISN